MDLIMKRISWPAVLVLFLCCCSGCSDSASPEDTPAERMFLTIGTAPPGGAFFVVGGAIGEVLDQQQRGHNWKVTAEATMGSQENIRRLASGELDLALSNSAISYFAARGEGAWSRPHPLRSVMTLAANVALFVTPADSGVRTIADLKGKRVVVGPAGAGFEYFLGPLLTSHGVRYEDFSPVYGTQAAAVDMLADGSASAAFLGGAVPTASVVQACASRAIFFVPFDLAARSRLVGNYPFFRTAVIPRGTYRGQEEDFQGLDVGSMHLITAADQDEGLIYDVTRILYENRAAVEQKHAAGKSINPTNVVRATGTDFHPGAVRYYQEIGIWPTADMGSEAPAAPSQ